MLWFSQRYRISHILSVVFISIYLWEERNYDNAQIQWLMEQWQVRKRGTPLILNSLRPSDAYICVSKLTIMDSYNGLSPARRQAIIWTNAGILLIGPLGTNFNEISIEIHLFSFKKMHLKISSGKWRPFWLGLNVLKCLCSKYMALNSL